MVIAIASLTIEGLKNDKQWVVYTLGKKKPCNPLTGYGVDCNEPAEWATYDEAINALHQPDSVYLAIGRMFVRQDGITGIDLDHCIDDDGNFTPFAQRVVKFFNSYTEYSPSGHGLHIWVRGNLPDNLNTAKDLDGDEAVEAYDSKRGFTITEKHLEGTPTTIEARQLELLTFHKEISERRRKAKAEQERENLQKKAVIPSTRATPSGGNTKYGMKALDDECQRLRTMPEGGRNSQLNTSAFALGQLIAGGELEQVTVENDLYNAAAQCGLSESEITSTLVRALEAGKKEPRTASPSSPMPLKQPTRKTEQPSAPAPAPAPRPTPTNMTPEPLPDVQSNALDLCSFSDDDAGNSDAMNALYGTKFLYCAALGWFHNTGTHWAVDNDGAEVKKCAIETLRLRRHAAVDAQKETIIKCTKADERRVNGCVSLFKTHVSVSIDVFDSDPDTLNCQNGVLDLRTGNITPHSQNQRFTYCVPVRYNPLADTGVWLDSITGVVGDSEVLDYLQMAAGYSLTGQTREEILFYLYGPPRSGKGTYAETFMKLLPKPLSTMVDFNSFTAKREGDVSNFDLAPLKPARLIFASESNRAQSLNPAKIKQLTGGDYIRACYKHKDFFDYRPQFKVWMMSNHPVNGDPEDDALWGRVRVIEFPHSFLGNEDKSKKARLKEPDVLEGVLAWAVQGAMKWYALGAKGLTTPDAIAKTTQAQRAELDYVQQWLDEVGNDETEETGPLWTSNEVVTASYLAWCDNNNVQHKKGAKALAQSLKAKGYRVSESHHDSTDHKTKRGVGGLHIFAN